MTEQEIKELGAELRKATLEAGHMYEIPNPIEQIKWKRRWELIIAIAGRSDINGLGKTYPEALSNYAKEVIEHADAIIKRLEDEPETTST